MGEFTSLEHGFKSAVTKACTMCFRRGTKSFQKLNGAGLTRVLFLRPEKIGDMVISIPVFEALKQTYPTVGISIFASPRNRSLVDHDPRIERVFVYRKNFFADLAELRRVRRLRYDCVFDMIWGDSVTTLFLSQLCAQGAPRIGIGKREFAKYYDFNVDSASGAETHIIDNTLLLLRALNIGATRLNRHVPPFVPKEVTAEGERIVGALRGSDRQVRVVGFNLSAGSPSRIWAEENSVALVRRLLGAYQPCRILLLTAPEDRSRAESIKSQFPKDVEIVPDGLSLLGAAAVVGHLDLLISPDTSMIHIARAFGVPVVGLYSRALWNVAMWRPYGQTHGAVVSGDANNIFDITVDQVMAAVAQVEEERRAVTN